MPNICNIGTGNSILDELVNNKSMYFQLDERDKYDYVLLKKIFTIFCHDAIFLEQVYNDLVANVKEDWVLEFSLRMIDVLNSYSCVDLKKNIKNPNEDILSTRQVQLDMLEFDCELSKRLILSSVENILNKENNHLGVGFALIQYKFNYSEIILDYFVKHFISEIFLELDLEEYLHQKYESFEDFENTNNTRTFAINYISLYDVDLSYYIIGHPEVLKEILIILNYIKDNWLNYTMSQKHDICEEVADKIFEYIRTFNKDKDSDTINDIWDTVYYTLYDLEVLDDVFPFLIGVDNEYLEIVKNECERLKLKDVKIKNTICYSYLKKVVNTLFTSTKEDSVKKKRK